jgi:hypothetical protein
MNESVCCQDYPSLFCFDILAFDSAKSGRYTRIRINSCHTHAHTRAAPGAAFHMPQHRSQTVIMRKKATWGTLPVYQATRTPCRRQSVVVLRRRSHRAVFMAGGSQQNPVLRYIHIGR